jgi:hypothetical protein
LTPSASKGPPGNSHHPTKPNQTTKTVLDRARLFLPELQAANARLPGGAPGAAHDPVIVEVPPEGDEEEGGKRPLRKLRLPDGTVLKGPAGGSSSGGGGGAMAEDDDQEEEDDGSESGRSSSSGEESESGSDEPDGDGEGVEVAMDLACGVVELRDEQGVAAAEAAVERGGRAAGGRGGGSDSSSDEEEEDEKGGGAKRRAVVELKGRGES